MNFKILFVGAISMLSVHVYSALPECTTTLEWAHTSWEMNKSSRGGYHQGPRMIKGLDDENFVPVFGKPFDQMSFVEIEALKPYFKECAKEGRKLAHEVKKAGDRGLSRKYQLGSQFMQSVLRLGIPDRDPSNFINTMTHQQKNYQKSKEAIAFADQQWSQAQALAPTMESISELTMMPNAPMLKYLSKNDQAEHINRLNERATKIADTVIVKKVAEFDRFEGTFAGLQEFLAFVRTTLHQMRDIQSREWVGFQNKVLRKKEDLARAALMAELNKLSELENSYGGLKEVLALHKRVTQGLHDAQLTQVPEYTNAYTERLNQISDAALKGFKEELKTLPVSAKSISKMRGSVDKMFSQPPWPNNIDQYRQVVEEQVRIATLELSKKDCYPTLTAQGLNAESHNVAFLSAEGSTTFGLFVCQLLDRDYKFLAYSSPGFLSSTHGLSLKMPRGIGLELEFEPLEVSPGETLLVGVSAQDASEKTSFSLAQWQSYAKKLLYEK